jgi:hypothetical protein
MAQLKIGEDDGPDKRKMRVDRLLSVPGIDFVKLVHHMNLSAALGRLIEGPNRDLEYLYPRFPNPAAPFNRDT